MDQRKNKLNLGCGRDMKKGYLNVDSFPGRGVDKLVNLNNFPWPFEDNSFEEILMRDILEHLDSPEKALEEVYRICKNSARVFIRVPHFSSANFWADLTHKRAFSSECLNRYEKGKEKTSSFEDERKISFRIKKIKLSFPAPYRWMGFNQFWSMMPKIYERFFYGLFPCGNIYFDLTIRKR